MKNTTIKYALLDAALTALYIVLISSFLFFIPKMFAPDTSPSFLAPVVMLSLLVFSAAVTGSLVFGRPILWYLDGKKREAVELLAYTLGFFFILTCVFYAALITLPLWQ